MVAASYFFIVGDDIGPSLLYYSLSNEICGLNDHLKVVMCSSPNDIKKQIANKSNIRVFIDEMTWETWVSPVFNQLIEDTGPDSRYLFVGSCW